MVRHMGGADGGSNDGRLFGRLRDCGGNRRFHRGQDAGILRGRRRLRAERHPGLCGRAYQDGHIHMGIVQRQAEGVAPFLHRRSVGADAVPDGFMKARGFLVGVHQHQHHFPLFVQKRNGHHAVPGQIIIDGYVFPRSNDNVRNGKSKPGFSPGCSCTAYQQNGQKQNDPRSLHTNLRVRIKSDDIIVPAAAVDQIGQIDPVQIIVDQAVQLPPNRQSGTPGGVGTGPRLPFQAGNR